MKVATTVEAKVDLLMAAMLGYWKAEVSESLTEPMLGEPKVDSSLAALWATSARSMVVPMGQT